MDLLIEYNNWSANYEQIINDMFKEFDLINQRSSQEQLQLLQQVYSQLENEQDLDVECITFTKSSQLLCEDLLFLCLKVMEHFSYYPRPVQLLSVLELYNHNSNKGRLAQIYTGEGKSLIVAMLAILLNKKKNSNVDVVTSSSVLATRDVEQLESFYKSFSVSVSHNINETQKCYNEMLPCYKCSVIYGDPHSFEADILRHEYSERGTMGSRKQEYIIVDEVDSMLIDGNSHKTMLSAPIPGMVDLTKVLRLIWDEICKTESNLSTENKVMIVDKDNYYSVDLKEYIESAINLQLEEVLHQFIPKYRLKYINFMKKTWIENAILAKYKLHQYCHYQIENDKVRIIDYQNTGVIHGDNMHLDKGLHQFVQLKHNISMTPLTINTNYLSNVSFFKRYKNKILGLTGTLGSQVTQNLLAKEYNVDFIFMPPNKKRLLKEETGYAAPNEEEWKNAIFQAVQEQMNKKRAVLIINRTIQDVHKIQQYFKQKNYNSIVYFDNNQKIDHEVRSGTLIIATNLAGRGTDLITNQDLEDNGGLHVIMSFLPRNIRIQQQGFGRTGRQGKKGTAQLIVNEEENCYLGNLQKDAFKNLKVNNKNPTSLDILVILRNVNEQFYSDEIEKEMKRLENEDRCFEKFCKIAKAMVNFRMEPNAFQELEERWGLYLEENQETGLNENDIEKILNSNDAQNPKYLISQGLQKENLYILQQAVSISEVDPSAQYYSGLYQIKQKQYEDGIQSLQKAKYLFQQKIDDEKGFSTALKLNRSQIDQFSNNLEEIGQYNIQEQIKMLPQLEFDLDPIQFIKQHQQSNQIDPTQNDQNFKQYQQQENLEVEVENNKIQENNINLITVEKYQNNSKIIDRNDQKSKNHIKPRKILKQVLSLFNAKKVIKMVMKETQLMIKKKLLMMDPYLQLEELSKQKKKKKKRKWWQRLTQFVLGIGQFLIGCAISALTCGAALPIGKTFIAGGISDMVQSVTNAWQGLDIDWGAWGKNKLINIASALVLAGHSGIKEALQLGSKGFQSLKQIGITEFLDQIPDITVDGLKKSGFWLSELTKQISKINTKLCNRFKRLLYKLQILIKYQIWQQKSQEIKQKMELFLKKLLKNYTIQSIHVFNNLKEPLMDFIKSFLDQQKNIQNYRQLKEKQKKEAQEICSIQGNKKYHGLQNRIEDYKQYEKRLNNEIKQFKGNYQICYNEDCELQKNILLLDIFFEKQSHQNEINQFINTNLIQNYLNASFNIYDKDIQHECDELKIPYKESMNHFYQKVIRPQFMKMCEEFKELCNHTEPIALIFQYQYIIHANEQVQRINDQAKQLADQQEYIKNQINQFKGNTHALNQLNQSIDNFNLQAQQFQEKKNQLNQIIQVDENLLAQSIINELKNKQLINNNGITISNTFLTEFQHYSNQQNYNNMMIQILQLTMESTLQELVSLEQNSLKKPFSIVLFKAAEIEILDEIEKYIFKSRIQKQDSVITSQYD
ncbi:unnamed protein product [Paramecium octaurelia]|uniref:Protein translocase subunit SecA n=1 Tax=Paramecium octaurelia TaxID=43137 RepID=A0A8S1WQH8_PAROT|nr:unnamed protein product [Paramecium octaurelia]